MPSDSVASFLELARENRLLNPDVVEELFRQPDVPQSDLTALCEFLVGRGVLTAYQADMIRDGRGAELNFAGYPILNEIGSGPGGTAYHAVHPTARTPVLLRRLRTDWFAPFDNAAAYLGRAQAAAAVPHPNLVPLLDAGVHRDEPFVAIEPFDGADLRSLVEDIGPMPVPLAAEYTRHAARGLEAAHAQGVTHGDVRPEHLLAGPLVKSSKPRPDGSPRYRPTAAAVVRVGELGLVPVRAKAADWPAEWEEAAKYLPPERQEAAAFTPAGDVYMLGATLYYLLTGQPPRYAPLAAARPDCPPEVVGLVREMMARDPAARPTMTAAAARLQAVVQTARATPPGEPNLPLNDSTTVPLGRDGQPDAALAEALFRPGESGEGQPPGWAGHPAVGGGAEPIGSHTWAPTDPPSHDSAEESSPLRAVRARPRAGTRASLWLWVGVFVLLNVLAGLVWLFVFSK
jgi:hypothetical protein